LLVDVVVVAVVVEEEGLMKIVKKYSPAVSPAI
jgi:hypothetical protein